jgi:hypothetical protein
LSLPARNFATQPARRSRLDHYRQIGAGIRPSDPENAEPQVVAFMGHWHRPDSRSHTLAGSVVTRHDGAKALVVRGHADDLHLLLIRAAEVDADKPVGLEAQPVRAVGRRLDRLRRRTGGQFMGGLKSVLEGWSEELLWGIRSACRSRRTHTRAADPLYWVGEVVFVRTVTGLAAKNSSLSTQCPKARLLPVVRRFRAAARAIPKRELNKLPGDFIENLDHYLYGTPKQ